ncbi:MAG: TetR/AcrR family transcriptional regulator [Planctomycetaceae bacterium]|nr:TetR/AcrR family transcriptional regulator [Planctomycetaceae bacterium]
MRVTAETKAVTRQRILDSAQQLFAARGFEATTTRDIAQTAEIAVGTLFNYFPTKEAIVECLVGEATTTAHVEFARRSEKAAPLEDSSLEEELFAFVAAGLRKMKPLRKYLVPLLETTLCPMARTSDRGEAESLRITHLEHVRQLVVAQGLADAFSPVAIQLYWTLYTGVLAFWANDKSPKQEDTLALVDDSLNMFVGWLRDQAKTNSPRKP